MSRNQGRVKGEAISLGDAGVCASIGELMLLIDVSKEEFLTSLYSFVAFFQGWESHLEGPIWPNIGHGCVPSLAGDGEGMLGPLTSGRLKKWGSPST